MAQFGESGLFGQVLRSGNGGFRCGSKGATAKKACKCSIHCRQFEAVEFTQSWIVIV
jgi:hypothetical protein